MKSVRNLSIPALTLLTVLFFSFYFYGCQKESALLTTSVTSIDNTIVETRGNSFPVGVSFLNKNETSFSAKNPVGSGTLTWTRGSDVLPIIDGARANLKSNINSPGGNYQAHHIIPFNLVTIENPQVKYAALDGFHINAGYNGISMETTLTITKCKDDNQSATRSFTVAFHSRADGY